MPSEHKLTSFKEKGIYDVLHNPKVGAISNIDPREKANGFFNFF